MTKYKVEHEYLKSLLNDILEEQIGSCLYKKISSLINRCTTTKNSLINKENDLLNQNTLSSKELLHCLEDLDNDTIFALVHSYNIYFQLINIAEDIFYHHQDQEKLKSEAMVGDSIINCISSIKDKGIAKDKLKKLIKNIEITPVITAHPTEAKRQTNLQKHLKIYKYLMNMTSYPHSKHELDNLRKLILVEIQKLWQTGDIRLEKPTVIQEVHNMLFYFDKVFYNVIDLIYKELEDSLNDYYKDTKFDITSFLKFGSWVGGDRDGNPNVTTAITRETLKLHKELILKKYISSINQLIEDFSQSKYLTPHSNILHESLNEDIKLFSKESESIINRNPHEPFRMKLAFISKKLNNTLLNNANKDKFISQSYHSPDDFLDDLLKLRKGLLESNGLRLAQVELDPFIRKVKVFGFHLAKLDIRQHSERHHLALSEIFNELNIYYNYINLHHNEKIKILTHELNSKRPLIPCYLSFSKDTTESFSIFKEMLYLKKEISKDCLASYIISMTHDISDLLAVQLLAKEAGLCGESDNEQKYFSYIDIVPLFETIEDLRLAHIIMEQAFNNPSYRKNLNARNNIQEIMIGYSDSNKEGGIIASNWELHQTQKRLTEMSDKYNIHLKLFHGRGGTISRGGSDYSGKAIASQPEGTIKGKVKMTEQGEVLSYKYSYNHTAIIRLGLLVSNVISSTLNISRKSPSRIKDYETALDKISKYGYSYYRKLIDNPNFFKYFKEATPFNEVTLLKLGSRPAKRKNSDELSDIRAIPWVFSWTQSRHLLSGWYSIGYAINKFIKEDPEKHKALLTEMFDKWLFFQILIENVVMNLVKTDMDIAKNYASIVSDNKVKEVYDIIKKEHDLTVDVILLIKNQDKLLLDSSSLKKSIDLRKPYIDFINHIQIILLQRLRKNSNLAKDQNFINLILRTINCIAAGMRNTG